MREVELLGHGPAGRLGMKDVGIMPAIVADAPYRLSSGLSGTFEKPSHFSGSRIGSS